MLTFTDILLPKWRESETERKRGSGEGKREGERERIRKRIPWFFQKVQLHQVHPSPVCHLKSHLVLTLFYVWLWICSLVLTFPWFWHGLSFLFFFPPLMTLIRVVLFLDANFKNYVTFPRILSTILLMEQSKCSKPKWFKTYICLWWQVLHKVQPNLKARKPQIKAKIWIQLLNYKIKDYLQDLMENYPQSSWR